MHLFCIGSVVFILVVSVLEQGDNGSLLFLFLQDYQWEDTATICGLILSVHMKGICTKFWARDTRTHKTVISWREKNHQTKNIQNNNKGMQICKLFHSSDIGTTAEQNTCLRLNKLLIRL